MTPEIEQYQKWRLAKIKAHEEAHSRLLARLRELDDHFWPPYPLPLPDTSYQAYIEEQIESQKRLG